MMAELTSYQLSHLVPFSSEVLFALYETYNQEVWPMPLLWLAASIAVIILSRKETPGSHRAVWGIATAAWLWVGLVFHRHHLATLLWAADWLAALIAVEAVIIGYLGVIRNRLPLGRPQRLTAHIGFWMFVVSAFVPTGVVLGQRLPQTLLFGWGATHTALGTLGLVLMSRAPRKFPVIASLIPMLWCVVASLMYLGIRPS